MSRLLYSVLKSIESGKEFSNKDYRMAKHEFDDFIRTVIQTGYINNTGIVQVKLEVSPLGYEFMQQHRQYELELPLKADMLPHWVRFEGEHYRPRPPKNKFDWSSFNYDLWQHSLETALAGCKRKGGEGKLQISGKATTAELAQIEATLNIKLPDGYKAVLLNFSKRVYFFWHITDPTQACLLTDENKRIENGGLFDEALWDVEALPQLNQERLDHVDCQEKDEAAPDYWANSFIFAGNGCGDYLAIDMKYHPGEVIYLSHEVYSASYSLGESFQTFLDNWIRIGCSGSLEEDFQAFRGHDSPYVDHTSANSVAVKDWLGLGKIHS